ncbi:branched-chain amino acid ABC transporter permease [Pseudochelatococcus contaminans]|uniref:Branched-chain amino acid transport system permease protein n=1 Tax=Pseudochelatococcus contaminans TaxID=1538103 RepID=A0A7W5Z3U9_9HYPH|nr:branched-chain amino acid ABC transporter permease [Pseudochelatococcus contaminans]MBB3809274.1 branched-chain amino acid transport system permease protein [Pseudochelatococcus contaminans]
MDIFITQLSNGLAIGSIYALVALGYTMVYGILRLINFAHGDLFTIGAYFGLTILVSFALQGNVSPLIIPWILIIMAAIGVAIIGFLLERVAYRPLRNANRLAAVVSAFGASIFFANALKLIYSPNRQSYPADIINLPNIPIFGVDIQSKRLIMFGTAVLLMALLYWYINHTRTGTAIRAVAIDQGAAKLMGINVNKIISLVFIIGPALGGAAGVLMGLFYGQIHPEMGFSFGLKAFVAAIIGGIGNIPGAMLGGLLLGVVEAIAGGYVSGSWKDAIAFGALIVILIFRPTGILGERVADKI